MLSPETRRRLEVQGFVGLDDRTLEELNWAFKLTPALCMTCVASGTALHSTTLLWALAPLAALGAILPFHPFDLIYNYGLRFLAGTRPLPPNAPPRRFACGLGAVWISAEALCFHFGAPLTAAILGWTLTAFAGLVTATHICVPSLVYRALFGRRLKCDPQG